ncbi:hypothetical protein [Arsenicibacter rosenii]|uniref:Uncharacterized protein n=1 Tax=Arsenicibacter rosenii TaxID=1750698 RepID=A0A1S2VHE2_9BACT|nr:hypothetical protein [Arsenicibacter rosenii]OIN58149.1 hypothetical protein BLX24_16660 [Arsenicibacter rosenii]
MNRNKRIFITVFIAFLLVVILITIDMARRTTAPWNKRKQLERALPGGALPGQSGRDTNAVIDGTAIDTTGLDTVNTK